MLTLWRQSGVLLQQGKNSDHERTICRAVVARCRSSLMMSARPSTCVGASLVCRTHACIKRAVSVHAEARAREQRSGA